MPTYPTARFWNIGPNLCPDIITTTAPEGYGDGCAALAIGGIPGTMFDINAGPTQSELETWLNDRMGSLKASFGLTDVAASTVVARHAGPLLWTLFWDPTGQVAPAEPKIPLHYG